MSFTPKTLPNGAKRYRIAIAVQGRFHAFDLACALLEAGHDVTLLTSLPASRVLPSGFPLERTISHPWLGYLQKLFAELQAFGIGYPVQWIAPFFGRWVARTLRRLPPFDVLHLWSESAEESLRQFAAAAGADQQLRMVVRGSSHIRFQARLLAEEAARSGAPQERPTEWVCQREEREYALAHLSVVPSSFAKHSFLAQGIDQDRVFQLTPGTPAAEFAPTEQAITERLKRYQNADQPLRILVIATVCYRKGLHDFALLIRSLQAEILGGRIVFCWTGPIAQEAENLVAELRTQVQFPGKRTRAELKQSLAWADLFLLPTIEDGFPQVLAQAAVSGLPIITTPNGSGSDLVKQEITGWIVPARDASALRSCVLNALESRSTLAQMSQALLREYRPRSWRQAAQEYQSFLDQWFKCP